MAFELVFKEPSKDAVKSPIQSPPKQISLEDIKKKQERAEERRKVKKKMSLSTFQIFNGMRSTEI